MLKKIQHDFLTALNNDKKEQFLQHIRADEKLTPGSRFNIYKDSINESLASSLRETYKACEKLVGKAFFKGLATAYIKSQPSHSPDLNDYGDNFAEFVKHFAPAKELPYLADICQLCWFWHRAYLSKPSGFIDVKQLATLSEEQQGQLVFLLPKHSYLLASDFPIYQIWQLCRKKTSGQDDVNLNQDSEKLLIWRKENNVQIDLLNDKEYKLLQLLKKEKDINQISNELPSLTTLLPIALNKGWLESFKLKSNA